MKTHVRAFVTAMQAQKRFSNNTILGYASDLLHFTNYLENQLGRPVNIADLSVEQITAYFEAERLSKKPSTLRRRYAALKRFIQFLRQTDSVHIPELPKIEKLLPPDPRAGPHKTVICLSDEEIQALISTVNADTRPQAKRDVAILAALLETGLSSSRLVALNKSDYDAVKCQLRLQRSNGETFWFLLQESNKFLKTYLLEGRPELNPHPNEEALFISQMGMRVSRQGLWQICQRWGARSKLPGGLSPRKLHYTAVQRLIQSGYSEKQIQAILDHQTLAATRALLEKIPIP